MRKFEVLEQLQGLVRVETPKKDAVFIEFNNGHVVMHHDRLILARIHGDTTIYLGEAWDYSTTTSQVRNMYCMHDTKTLNKMLASGEAIKVRD